MRGALTKRLQQASLHTTAPGNPPSTSSIGSASDVAALQSEPPACSKFARSPGLLAVHVSWNAQAGALAGVVEDIAVFSGLLYV